MTTSTSRYSTIARSVTLGLFLVVLLSASGCATVSWSAGCTLGGGVHCNIKAAGQSKQIMCAVKSQCTKMQRAEAFFANNMRKIANFFVTDAYANTLFDPSSGRVDDLSWKICARWDVVVLNQTTGGSHHGQEAIQRREHYPQAA